MTAVSWSIFNAQFNRRSPELIHVISVSERGVLPRLTSPNRMTEQIAAIVTAMLVTHCAAFAPMKRCPKPAIAEASKGRKTTTDPKDMILSFHLAAGFILD